MPAVQPRILATRLIQRETEPPAVRLRTGFSSGTGRGLSLGSALQGVVRGSGFNAVWTLGRSGRRGARVERDVGAGPVWRRHHQDRRAERPVRHLCRPVGPGLGLGRAQGRRGFLQGQQVPRQDRDRGGRPPEQAGHRRQRRAPMARCRQGRRDRRRADLVGHAGRQQDRAGEEQGPAGLRWRLGRHHRQGLHAQHDPLDLRHLGAGQRHRPGHREDRRRHLVLPDGRLCLRPCARARHRGVVTKNGGKVLGAGAPSLPDLGLLLVPAAGAELEGRRSSAWPMPAPTPPTPSSRRPSSASSRAARTSRACWSSSPTCTRSASRRRKA